MSGERMVDAQLELEQVLRDLGLQVATADGGGRGEGRADLILGDRVVVEVKSAVRPNWDQLVRLVKADHDGDRCMVLVADRLGPGQRELLAEHDWGWLDRSGHLRIMWGGIAIDRTVDSLLGPDISPPDPLGRPSGLAVAFALLQAPKGRASVRDLAARTDLSVGAVSEAMKGLADIGLLDPDRRAVTPDLFWELAGRWRVRWFGLDAPASTSIEPAVQQLVQMQLGDVDAPGWAEVGVVAAQRYGVPVVAERQVHRLYVPSQRALTWALRTWGEARAGSEAAVQLAVPPVDLATRYRRAISPDDGPWPVAAPLAVALELASERDPRSRDVLDAWSPDASLEQPRVW